MPGVDVIVFSRTLPSTTSKGLRIVKDDPREVVAALKAKPGRDIWLFGGGTLFRTLLDAGLVDSVEVAVMPVLLGSGVPRNQGRRFRVSASRSEVHTKGKARRGGYVWRRPCSAAKRAARRRV